MATMEAVVRRYAQRKFDRWNEEPIPHGLDAKAHDDARGMALEYVSTPSSMLELRVVTWTPLGAAYEGYLFRTLENRREIRGLDYYHG